MKLAQREASLKEKKGSNGYRALYPKQHDPLFLFLSFEFECKRDLCGRRLQDPLY